jgi:hypothetical protein
LPYAGTYMLRFPSSEKNFKKFHKKVFESCIIGYNIYMSVLSLRDPGVIPRIVVESRRPHASFRAEPKAESQNPADGGNSGTTNCHTRAAARRSLVSS